MRKLRIGLTLMVAVLLYPLGCGGNDNNGGENAGSSCSSADQCYLNIDKTKLQGGAPVCLTVQGGYCTHLCATDADCCAVPGECQSKFPQKCGPFQSTGMRYCFLSCDPMVVQAAGYQDSASFCQGPQGSPDFTCRSTGGGMENIQVCAP